MEVGMWIYQLPSMRGGGRVAAFSQPLAWSWSNSGSQVEVLAALTVATRRAVSGWSGSNSRLASISPNRPIYQDRSMCRARQETLV